MASLAELRAQAGHAPDHDAAGICKLGQAARNPLKIGQPLFLVAFGPVCPADAPGFPPEETPGQGLREVSRLVDDKGIMMATSRKPSIPPVIAPPD